MSFLRFALLHTLLLVHLSFLAVFAQQEFALNGVVFEKGTKLRVALVEVSNLRNKYSVGTNDIGFFQIKALVGDTLSVSKRGFVTAKIVVGSSKDFILYLEKGNTLDEVVILGQSKKQALNDIKRDFKNKGSFYAGKPPFLAFIFSPLTALYELFGRTPKNARRFNNYYVTELQQTHIDGLFNKVIINKHTGLVDKELENFMINYRPDYERAKNWAQYDAIKWINDSFKKYSDSKTKNP
jgi:hypothetical protein